MRLRADCIQTRKTSDTLLPGCLFFAERNERAEQSHNVLLVFIEKNHLWKDSMTSQGRWRMRLRRLRRRDTRPFASVRESQRGIESVIVSERRWKLGASLVALHLSSIGVSSPRCCARGLSFVQSGRLLYQLPISRSDSNDDRDEAPLNLLTRVSDRSCIHKSESGRSARKCGSSTLTTSH